MFMLAFAIFVQVVGLRFMGSMTLSIQGEVSVIRGRQALFAALFFQLFIGFFMSAVYGIWMVPYSHQGNRSSLTYVLPVSKWCFPVVYPISFLLLLVLQYAVMFLSLGFIFGWDVYGSQRIAWNIVGMCLFGEALGFITCMMGFAVASLSFGQIATFFLGTAFLFVTQMVGILGRFMDKLPIAGGGLSAWKNVQKVYGALPPLGELVFDLRETFGGRFVAYDHWWKWGIWFLVFALLFRWKLRYPATARSGEI
jgi:hypothetical protein